MKTKSLWFGGVLCALSLTLYPTNAQTWQIADDFTDPLVLDTAAQAMGRDAYGNIYAAGYITLNDNTDRAAIRRSMDGGATWSLVDAYTQGPGPLYEYAAMASDPAGNVYAAGYSSSSIATSFVRRSSDGGTTWSTVDSLSGWVPRGAAADGAGDVYVVGRTYPGYNWVIRKGVGGTSWSTVDSFNPGYGGSAHAVLCHPTAGVFVVGTASTRSGGPISWYVRRSQNGGASWATVDVYAGDSALGIASDPAGNIYTAGASAGRWIVRKSSNGGASWATVDDFKLPCTTATKPKRTTCYNAKAAGVAVDAWGRVFVSGNSESPTGIRWIVRASASVGNAGSWQTVDEFQYAAGKTSTPFSGAIVADALGHVFVGGWGADNSGANNGYGLSHWLVRKN